MITVYTIGHLNGGQKQSHSVSASCTAADLLRQMGLDPANVSFKLNGRDCGLNETLYDGASIAYAMRNIKGA